MSKYEKIKDLADIIIAKNRNGPVGTITLHFDREHMVFSSYNPNGDPYNYAGHTPLPQGNNANAIPNIANQNMQTAGSIAIEPNGVGDFSNAFASEEDDAIPDDLKGVFE